jgi:hypothetical protein
MLESQRAGGGAEGGGHRGEEVRERPGPLRAYLIRTMKNERTLSERPQIKQFASNASSTAGSTGLSDMVSKLSTIRLDLHLAPSTQRFTRQEA